jgi:hypothetical protein
MYKKGDNSFNNYIPISLLISFSKIFERVIYKRLYQHLSNNNILVNEQFGFRISSTDKAVCKLLDQVLTALNNKYIVGGIFCDLEKAFDRVNHKILLSKLEVCGISGSMCKLLMSYFEGRFQRITLQSKHPNLNIYLNGVRFYMVSPRDLFLGLYFS